MKVIITGTHGYIARHLQEHMTERGVETLMLNVRGGAWRDMSFNGYDAVIHLAGAAHNSVRSAAEFHEINADLTAALARKAGAVPRFIFISSMAVYGVPDSFDVRNEITAQTPLSPQTPYGASKLAGERHVLDICGATACIVRPPMVYGENCPGNYALLRKLVLRFRTVPRVENRRSMIYVRNLCEFLFLLVKNGDTGVFHPQDNRTVSTVEIAECIGRMNSVRVNKVPVPFLPLAAKFLPQLGKAFGSLSYAPELSEYNGYRLFSVEEALERTERFWSTHKNTIIAR